MYRAYTIYFFSTRNTYHHLHRLPSLSVLGYRVIHLPLEVLEGLESHADPLLQDDHQCHLPQGNLEDQRPLGVQEALDK